jgi:class 3 adenylate cyclase/CheY-like chemotaxis protein
VSTDTMASELDIEAASGAPCCPAPGETAEAPDRTRRYYLTQRRHELLGPVNALTELTRFLAEEEKIRACERALGNITVIGNKARCMADMIADALRPGMIGMAEDAARILNHDLRSLLTVILGYGDDLRRVADKYFLDDFVPEFDQLRGLGHRILSLVDSTVSQLRSSGRCELVDGLQRYLERCAGPGGLGQAEVRPAAEPGRIVVAEDDDRIRELLCEYLRSLGHGVVAARDGLEALEIIRSGPFDLLLTDIEMPKANGLQVLDQIAADPNLCGLPVIVISGHGELEAIAHCITMGAEDYLPKPFNRVILSARVNAALEKKRLRERTEQQRRRYNELLLSILPASIVGELLQTNTVRPRRCEEVAVLFADIVGFTSYCDHRQEQPELVVQYLRRMFEAWEEMAQALGVQKIKTIGDAFMGASGLLEDVENPVLNCVLLGIQMIEFTQAMCDEDGNPLGFDLRVGIHYGPVVAAVLGRRQSLYDLWGDTVNVASRLESNGRPGCVNLSVQAWRCISDLARGETRGFANLKGKGEPVEIIHLQWQAVVLDLPPSYR